MKKEMATPLISLSYYDKQPEQKSIFFRFCGLMHPTVW